MKLEIDGRKDEVEEVLKDALSLEEYKLLKIDTVAPGEDALSSEPRRIDPLTWVGLAMAGGVIGNGTYELVKRAAIALVARFGKDRVSEKGD